MKRLLLLLLMFVAGCETISYYGQAIRGQLGLLAAARPIESWLADPATPAELRARLETARGIREYASRSLGLPDNASYGSYAELRRPYPVWNVFAAPRFSIEPKQECFPFTGCVSSRGWFDDPLLSSFIKYPDAQLARLLFHELAHQRVYARDDTTFNESFAVAVEEEGVRRWLEAQGRGGELDEFRAAQARKREFARQVQDTRKRLAEVYRMPLSEEAMLSRKREEYAKLRAAYPNIVPEEANNAYLGSVALYTELVPQFEKLLAAHGGDLPAFYREVERLASSEPSSRGPLSARPR
jgi:predicted aminopeptidase